MIFHVHHSNINCLISTVQCPHCPNCCPDTEFNGTSDLAMRPPINRVGRHFLCWKIPAENSGIFRHGKISRSGKIWHNLANSFQNSKFTKNKPKNCFNLTYLNSSKQYNIFKLSIHQYPLILKHTLLNYLPNAIQILIYLDMKMKKKFMYPSLHEMS